MRARLLVSCLLLVTTLTFLSGCNGGGPASTQPTSIPGPTTDGFFNSVKIAADNIEAVANSLAAMGLIPQVDVTLASNLVHMGMNAWQSTLTPRIGMRLDPLAQAEAESTVHERLAKLQALVAKGEAAKVARTRAARLAGQL